MLTKLAPSHYLIDELLHEINTTCKKHRGISITFRWTPGHEGIEGNKRADKEAKKAITDSQGQLNNPPKILHKELPHSKSALGQSFHATLKLLYLTLLAQEVWTESPRYERAKLTLPAASSNKYLLLTCTLSRKHTSILTQLRTAHIPLAKHLHCMGKAESPLCPTCHEHDKTVIHFILLCPAFVAPWRVMQTSLGPIAHDLSKILNLPTALKPLFRYIEDTKRFLHPAP
ncbi:hypothetical protein BYT27DRAFT_7109773 [Phlegmacium glaucopus]|nr:hypothetical protein BYT27DRAFT_7109773 [Phlegmacium glaucopus]